MVNNEDFSQDDSSDEEWVSRTQIKKQALALQALGEKLATFSKDQLKSVPMSDTLRAALEECQRIKPRSGAMKRHMNYVGRLMRTEDAEQIEQAIGLFEAGSQAHTAMFHKLERWRDRLIQGGNEELQAFIQETPEADIQHLRQLTRNAKKEAEREQSPAAARKLFKYLRELAEAKL
ncbi:MAG: ribosome biogenesis factor YjgA [Pontibacterium sp.]